VTEQHGMDKMVRTKWHLKKWYGNIFMDFNSIDSIYV